MISALSAQLASLKIATGELENADSIVKEIESVKKALSDKEKSLSDQIASKNEEDLKRYNSLALKTIENINNAYNNKDLDKGKKDREKKDRRINLLIQLEKIQLNYLYISVANLYQQVYQEIWS